MTLRTNLYLPVAREFRRIHDPFCRRSRALGSMTGNMFTARTVTPLAGDADHDAGLIVTIIWFRPRERLYIRCVTLQAAGNNRSVKVCYAIRVTRTVDPLPDVDPVRHRKLKKPISLPVEIGLSFSC